MRLPCKIAVAALTIALTTAAHPGSAHAVTQEERDAAQAQLNTLGTELSSLQMTMQEQMDALEDVRAELAVKQTEIDATTSQLSDARVELSDRMRSNYKAGDTSLLSVLLGSSDFETLISNIYYADRIAAQNAAAIDAVQTLQSQLVSEKTELEAVEAAKQEALDETTDSAAAYDAKVSEARRYFNSLDAELQTELAAQAAEEAKEAAESDGETSVVAQAVQAVTQADSAQAAVERVEAAESSQPSSQPAEQQAEQQAEEQPQSQQADSSAQRASDYSLGNWNSGYGTAVLAARVAGNALPDDGLRGPSNSAAPTYPSLQEYRAIMDAVTPYLNDGVIDNRTYASCHQAASAIIRATVDPDINMLNPGAGLDYMRNSSKWTKVGDSLSFSEMQPGDIMIQGNNHTCIYVSNDVVRQFWPDSWGNVYEASWGRVMYPTITYYDSAAGYEVWRCTNPSPGIRNFINVDAVLNSV